MDKSKAVLKSKGSLAIYYDPSMRVFRASANYVDETQRIISVTGITRQGVLDKINQLNKNQIIQS